MTEPAVSSLLSVAEAIEIIDSTPLVPRVVRVSLNDAQGLYLAQDIIADRDYPPFDRSLMDGYAVRAADFAGERVTLLCLGEIAAGDDPSPGIGPGQTVAIMTGAALPEGADAVVPVEQRIARDGRDVQLAGPAVPRRFIARRGSECSAGHVVLARGTRLGPAQLAVAATVGAAEVQAYARPRAAVLASGDEIVPFNCVPAATQIRNCNSIMLISLLARLGCDVSDLGMVRDDPRLIRQAIARGLAHDVLFISGGMSMGEHDYVPRVLSELGVVLKITRLRIKPGKPFVFGVAGHCFVFGLPGNPLSGFACTIRLCSRLLARLGGGMPVEKWTRAALASPLGPNGAREFYQPVILHAGTVQPLQWNGSADVFTLARANGLLVRAEGEAEQPTGAVVKVLEVPA